MVVLKHQEMPLCTHLSLGWAFSTSQYTSFFVFSVPYMTRTDKDKTDRHFWKMNTDKATQEAKKKILSGMSASCILLLYRIPKIVLFP